MENLYCPFPFFGEKMYLVTSGLHKMVGLVLLQSSTCGGWCISWRRQNVHLCHTGQAAGRARKNEQCVMFLNNWFNSFLLADAAFCRGHYLRQNLCSAIYCFPELFWSCFFITAFFQARQQKPGCCGWDPGARQAIHGWDHHCLHDEISPFWRGFVNHRLSLCAMLQHRVIYCYIYLTTLQ